MKLFFEDQEKKSLQNNFLYPAHGSHVFDDFASFGQSTLTHSQQLESHRLRGIVLHHQKFASSAINDSFAGIIHNIELIFLINFFSN